MRIVLVCNDTRGGVQPYVALGKGLAKAGHTVRAVAPAEFAPMFAEASLAMAPLSGGEEANRLRSTAVAEQGVIAAMRLLARELPAQINRWTQETLDGCEGAELITGGIGGMVTGVSVAEKLGVPFIETHLQPVGFPTDAYPGVMVPWWPRWLGAAGMRLSHHLSDKAAWMAFKKPMAAAREDVLGLRSPPRRIARILPVLYGFSRHVVPMPTHETRHACGYWSLQDSSEWQPPPALEAFLARGGPVVSIGFGSMTSANAEALTALVVRAVREAGVRAVLLSGWGGLSSSHQDSDVFCAEALPHTWLFPRVSAIVHHGGAGTTGAAMRAGVPSIVIPFAADQPFWAARTFELGVGTAPIARKALTAERLAKALLKAENRTLRARAAELGARLQTEDGVAKAVRHFEFERL
jgi:sterol 3beta-glucosyltransferase